MLEKKAIKYFDIWLVLLVVIIFALGLVTLGSALGIDKVGKNALQYNMFMKQIFGFVSGLAIMLFIAFFNYEFMKRMWIVFFVFNIGMLVFVLATPGTINNVSRWIEIGPFTIQPSEFAKILVILFLARYLEKYEKKVSRFLFLLLTAAIVLIPVGLIKMQPDLSTSLVLIFLFVAMLFVAGIDRKYILAVILIGVPLITFVIYDATQEVPIILEGYQADRIKALFDPEKYAKGGAYQTLKALEALASGRLQGHGLYSGVGNIPEAYNDFILAVLGDELGFVGCASAVALYVLIMIRCIWNAYYAPDLYGKLICTGVAALLTFQAFVNMGVATAILPNTGLPLPFFSYGLSSLWACMIGIGLVLNVGMMRKLNYARR